MTKPFAFVLIPFSVDFDDIYKLGIKAVADELEVLAERVDEQIFSETILERIYLQIDVADFIIADMSDQNPNVFYEVGYAHAKGKICILIAKNADDIPFDLKHHRHVIYGGSIASLKSLLTTEIEWIKGEIARRKSDVFAISLNVKEELLVKNYLHADAKIDLVVDIRNISKESSPQITALYLCSGDGWTFLVDGNECPSQKIDRDGYTTQHFIKAPVPNLASGRWARSTLQGSKHVWSRWSGEDLRDEYLLSGKVLVEIATSDKDYKEEFDLNVTVNEIPF